ncbi:hypothetical protein CXB51_003395 [Gossypium anomalum]|uniref:ATP synthase subunit d, mitochondrial n=2 Tax=Gossypium TaxID=3633 RepID=A0A8J5ZIS1_9ROSI|nr:hypothetical protein CXB51_003395 [Gossypium anomalum]
MSGPGKKVVDVAFKASKNIDWEGMAKLLVSDEARKEFATLRRTFDEVNSTLQTKFSQEPEPIDWEYYRKGIGSRLVDMYKEAYEIEVIIFIMLVIRFGWNFEGFTITNVIYSSIAGVEIPKFVDTVTPQYKPKFDALLVELKEAEEKSLKESERLEKEIAEVQELKQKISTMTADEYFEKHPELKKKFDDEIRNDYWGY